MTRRIKPSELADYAPPREKRRPTPHFDRLADRCDAEGWSLELARLDSGSVYVHVWATGRLKAAVRVDRSVDRAARAVLRAL